MVTLAAVLSLAGCDRSGPAAGATAASKLEYNTRISFGQGGGSDSFKVSGWSKTEEKFTWSEGAEAVLQMAVAPTNDSVILKMRLAALVKPPEFPSQLVEVTVNDLKIAEWQVGDTADFTAAIPHDIAKVGGVLTISIRTPKSTSPKALGLSADPRVLGICCLNLELSKG